MGDHTAFFYGTLMAREVLYRVCYGTSDLASSPTKALLASTLSIQPALLHNYCRHRVRFCDYPGIIPEPGHSVQGTYVTGLTDGDIYRLNLFEGDEYERRKVNVELLDGGAGEEREAWTYVYTAGQEYLEKKEWDLEEFRREKMWRWADGSHEYKEVDEAVEIDPTGGRAVQRDTAVKEEGEAVKSTA